MVDSYFYPKEEEKVKYTEITEKGRHNVTDLGGPIITYIYSYHL